MTTQPENESRYILQGERTDKGDVLIRGLTDKDPIARIIARAVAADVHGAMAQFLEAEDERGTSDTDVLTALLMIEIQLVASVVAAKCNPSSFEAMSELFQRIVQERFVAHAQKAHAWREENNLN